MHKEILKNSITKLPTGTDSEQLKRLDDMCCVIYEALEERITDEITLKLLDKFKDCTDYMRAESFDNGVCYGLELAKAYKTIIDKPRQAFKDMRDKERPFREKFAEEEKLVFEIRKAKREKTLNVVYSDDAIDTLHQEYMYRKEYTEALNNINSTKEAEEAKERFYKDTRKDEPILTAINTCYLDEGFRQGFKCAMNIKNKR